MSETSGRLQRPEGDAVAWRRIPGDGPTVVWLGGFGSEMAGTKAQVLADWAAKTGRDYIRFDYFGHGESSGDFLLGSITRWRADALAVIDELTRGPLVLVGSSMGGWLALLAAAARRDRLHGLVLVAPAADFTEALLKPRLPPQALEALERDGVWMGQPDQPITRRLLEDGARWSVMSQPVDIQAPVRILQGGRDDAVPWTHALDLAALIEADDLVFTLIKDGDHRLSRPRDLDRLIAAVADLA